ncbi:AbrB/MazE/SpoVT family DNA-binding domain-containing protein [Aureimonas leprariae]|uniref:AbrB/MazE/SpoVT family DNA-binding domain-containing protein n=1 Tax=Plantimonas leprariae TaxID=2615207 RepID=A0A7V7TW19_9HYPH|nr:AbrB/MazE/SpoVT family DNA-binding domain-containing protein [Aureimonas leprariae]KAB0679251.1 AbrB/MazE/SpoVT family DNA-binding domain-containing protein [Aureimonas leprariae]
MRLPAEVMERHGISEGGMMVLEDRGSSIVMRTFAEFVADIQAWSREVLGDKNLTVDDFLAERRRDAAREFSED